MGVKGRLKDMGLIDMVQIFGSERRTVAIHLGSEAGYGRVYIESGSIVHAMYREFKGTDALYRLLAWRDGEFEVEPEACAPERTITGPSEPLILEGLRRMDEARGKGIAVGAQAVDTESIRLINRLLELKILEKT
ncbi:MAG: DUF4388 domain-containing protein [Deltaproteobacteria bacterium]|nr:DUF4388 domain-containing protein [Deltaproteobacteria bacterium]